MKCYFIKIYYYTYIIFFINYQMYYKIIYILHK